MPATLSGVPTASPGPAAAARVGHHDHPPSQHRLVHALPGTPDVGTSEGSTEHLIGHLAPASRPILDVSVYEQLLPSRRRERLNDRLRLPGSVYPAGAPRACVVQEMQNQKVNPAHEGPGGYVFSIAPSLPL